MLNKIDHDRMNLADGRMVGRAAMTVIDRLQDFTPEEQALGLAASFLAFCHAAGIRPESTLQTASNVMAGMSGKRPELAAVEDYMALELGLRPDA